MSELLYRSHGELVSENKKKTHLLFLPKHKVEYQAGEGEENTQAWQNSKQIEQCQVD